ncbi:MAG: ABC transporter permease [Eubacteriaceae bacterium]|nr:ABC transporter permease [Eubacteriaceae bacterium]
MYKFKQIFILDIINLATNPMWLFTAIGFPVALVLVLGFLTSGSYGNIVSAYDYAGVAIMIFCVFNVATFSSNSFMEERIKKPNMRLVHSPIRHFYIYFSKILASFVFCIVAYIAAAIFLVFIAGVNYGGVDAWAIILIMLLGNFFFSALGVAVCCILRSEGAANSILSLLFALFAILGGLFFPVEGLGKAVVAISWISPGKWILAACLRIIYDSDFSMFLPVCSLFIILSAAALALCGRFFKGEDYL